MFIIANRKCCRKTLELTQERSIWVRTVKEQQQELPVPPKIIQNLNLDESLKDTSTEQLFEFALRILRIDQLWSRPRQLPSVYLEKRANASILLGIRIVLDRWLVLFYSEGVIQLYDLRVLTRDASAWKGLVAELEDFDHGPWVSFAAAVDPESQILILSTAKLVPCVIFPSCCRRILTTQQTIPDVHVQSRSQAMCQPAIRQRTRKHCITAASSTGCPKDGASYQSSPRPRRRVRVQ
jgi:hypothetical protein